MKPILFSTPMVQAILAGTKTQTRRAIKSRKHLVGEIEKCIYYKFENERHFFSVDGILWLGVDCPYGKVGEVLWVRETWNQRSQAAMLMGFEKYFFKAGWKGCTEGGWKPSIHMPFEACRLFLKIKSIRVERLQDITEEDATAEGIENGYCSQQGRGPDLVTYKNYLTGKQALLSAKESFQTLWISINGHESFDANPWVWVIEFEKTEAKLIAELETL